MIIILSILYKSNTFLENERKKRKEKIDSNQKKTTHNKRIFSNKRNIINYALDQYNKNAICILNKLQKVPTANSYWDNLSIIKIHSLFRDEMPECTFSGAWICYMLSTKIQLL